MEEEETPPDHLRCRRSDGREWRCSRPSMEGRALLPDHLRCRRTDGREWRCTRPALVGRALCEKHHLKGQKRSKKEPLPESLKLPRKNRQRDAFLHLLCSENPRLTLFSMIFRS
ncbi:hypothetical protein AMTRI_Chr03g139820 [Amborella trichopoda]